MEQITVAGKTFNAPVRYTEGHELTEGEASALNQTYHENLRNNFAKKVKEAVEAGSFDQEAFQSEFSKYADTYAFGVRTGGGGGGVTRDPVMSEALNIAKKIIREKIKAAGKKASTYTNEAITEAAKKLIDRDEKIMETAKARVAEQKALASDDLGDLLGGMAQKPAEQAAA